MPFKLNQDRRRNIPRQRHKVTNWPDYDASLRQRGSLTIRFTAEAVEAWAAEPRTTRGGQPWYSALAILTALTLRAVFRLACRQAEGLIGSIIGLLGLALRVPDHTTLSRRAATLEAMPGLVRRCVSYTRAEVTKRKTARLAAARNTPRCGGRRGSPHAAGPASRRRGTGGRSAAPAGSPRHPR